MNVVTESTPTTATPPPPPQENFKPKIKKRAVIYAILFDAGVSYLLGIISGFIYLTVISGGTFLYFSDLQKEITEYPAFSISFFIFGSIISVMAGYLAAQIGKHRPYAHALWAGSILSLVYFVSNFNKMTLMLTQTVEVHFSEVFFICYFPFGITTYLIGAHIYRLIHEQKNHESHK